MMLVELYNMIKKFSAFFQPLLSFLFHFFDPFSFAAAASDHALVECGEC